MTAVVVELVGVLVVGTLTVVDGELFPDQTVWSTYGIGYGFVPLVLPIVGLWWLLRHPPDAPSVVCDRQVIVIPPSTGSDLAGDVAGRGGGEEDDGRGQLLGLALATGRDPRLLRLEVAGWVLVGHLRVEEPRRDGVDPDALAAGPLLAPGRGSAR